MYVQKRGDKSPVSWSLASTVYSMNKTRRQQDLFVTRVNAAAQDLLSTYGSTCFGVKIDYNYGLRRRKLLVRNPFPSLRIVYKTVEGD
jgi:hypothetical protein